MKSLSLTTRSIFNFLFQLLVEFKNKEETSQFKKTESINNNRIRSCQADANKKIQQVQANYFLERRTFL